MAHNDHAVPYALWRTLLVPTLRILRRLDVGQYEGINGDDGGKWNPEKPIIIGGQGLRLVSSNQILGGVSTSRLAKVGGAIVLNDSDWPTYSAPRTRTVAFPIHDCSDTKDFNSNYIDGETPGSTKITGPNVNIVSPITSKRLVQGTNIASVKLCMRVGKKPSAIPSLPGFSLIGVSKNAQELKVVSNVPSWQPSTTYANNDFIVPTVIGSVGFQNQTGAPQTSGATEPAAFATANPGDTVVDGAATWTAISLTNPGLAFLIYSARMATPIDADAYYNNGQPQDIELLSPNVWPVLDPDNYTYYVSIVDDAQTNNVYHSVRLEMTGFTDMRPAV